jgi:hypothetical protein
MYGKLTQNSMLDLEFEEKKEFSRFLINDFRYEIENSNQFDKIF